MEHHTSNRQNQHAPTHTLPNESGSSLTFGGAITVGNAGLGVFNQSGGLVTVPNVNIGITGTNSNSYNLMGGTLVPIDKLLVGNGGVGTFNHTGGSVTAFQLF